MTSIDQNYRLRARNRNEADPATQTPPGGTRQGPPPAHGAPCTSWCRCHRLIPPRDSIASCNYTQNEPKLARLQLVPAGRWVRGQRWSPLGSGWASPAGHLLVGFSMNLAACRAWGAHVGQHLWLRTWPPPQLPPEIGVQPREALSGCLGAPRTRDVCARGCCTMHHVPKFTHAVAFACASRGCCCTACSCARGRMVLRPQGLDGGAVVLPVGGSWGNPSAWGLEVWAGGGLRARQQELGGGLPAPWGGMRHHPVTQSDAGGSLDTQWLFTGHAALFTSHTTAT